MSSRVTFRARSYPRRTTLLGLQVLCVVGLSVCVVACSNPSPVTRLQENVVFLATRVHHEFRHGSGADVDMSRARDLVGCRECEVLHRVDTFGREETFLVATEPYADISRARDVASVSVREEPRLSEGDGRFFSVNLMLKVGASSRLRRTPNLVPLWIATKSDGRFIGVEPVAGNSARILRVASFLSEDAAVDVGRMFGSVEVSRLDRESELRRRNEQRSILADVYWINKCDPDSEAAKLQRAEFERVLSTVPDLLESIDCREGPRVIDELRP